MKILATSDAVFVDRHLRGEDLSTLNISDLQDLEIQLEEMLRAVRTKKVVIRWDEYLVHDFPRDPHTRIAFDHRFSSQDRLFTEEIQDLNRKVFPEKTVRAYTRSQTHATY